MPPSGSALDRELDGRRPADRLEHEVGAAVGQVAQRLDGRRSVVRRQQAVGRAEGRVPRPAWPRPGRSRRSARRRRATAPITHDSPTPPSPMTATLAPGRHLGGLQDRPDPGRHAAADERRDRRIDAVGEGDRGRLRHDRRAGHRADPAIRQDRPPRASAEDRGAVGHPVAERRGVRACPWLARHAGPAHPARDQPRQRDRLPDGQRADAGPERLDDAGALVAHRDRRRRGQSPSRTWRSEWQTPDARIRTRTSPARGSASVSSSMVVGWPRVRSTAARVVVTSRRTAAARSGGPGDTGRSPATTSRRRRSPRGPCRRRCRRPPRDRLARHLERDRAGHRAQVADRRIERPGREALAGHGGGQGPGGEQEHPVRDRARLGGDRAEPQAGEDEDVVRLADLASPPVHVHGLERRTGGDDGPAVGPAQDVDGVASEAEVGFESGMTSGRSVPAASARRTASSNVPPTPVVPTRTVGRTRSMVSTSPGNSVEKPYPRRPRPAAPARASSRRGPRGRSWTCPRESTSTSARRMAASSIPSSSIASRTSRAIPIPAAPAPTSTTRVSRSPIREPAQPGQDPGHDDRRGPLDVVVERRHAIAVAVEDAQRVRLLEVLPLDDAARPDLGDALDEGLDQRVVLGARAGAARESRDRADRRAAPGCRSRRRARPAA